MKNTLCLTCFLFALLAVLPQTGYSAIAKPQQTETVKHNNAASAEGKTTKQATLREKIGRKFSKWKVKMRQWKERMLVNFPSGKILGSLVLLVAAILLFALAGLTVYASLFSILGSVAVVGAVLLFVLWMLERSKMAKPID